MVAIRPNNRIMMKSLNPHNITNAFKFLRKKKNEPKQSEDAMENGENG